MMDSSVLLALVLFATLVTGNGNLQDNKKDVSLPTMATRDIKAFPACITDSDCAGVTGLGGELADFKCFQSMCFPWATKELQGGQVEIDIHAIAIITFTMCKPRAKHVSSCAKNDRRNS